MTSKVPTSTNSLVNWSVTSLQMSAVPKGVWTNRLTSCSGTVRRDPLSCDDCQALTGGFRARAFAHRLTVGDILSLPLLRVARRISALVFAADMLSARFVSRLVLPLLVSYDPMLR
jgi:hypothetical protein